MSIPPGLDQNGFAALEQALRDGTRVATTITVRPLADTTQIITVIPDERVIDDQINFTVENHRADRMWSGGIDDPQHDLGMDTASISDGFGGLGLLLQPIRNVWVDPLGRWVPIPQGGYRPSAVKRQGSLLTIDAPDKSSLWLTPSLPDHLPINTNIFVAIRQTLRALGERAFAFPPDSATSAETGSKPIAIGGSDQDLSVWQVLVDLAASHGWQLYYDELSRAAIRRIPGEFATPTASFDKSNMTTELQPGTDLSILRNYEKATGKGSGSTMARTVRVLPEGNALSPAGLNVNGVPFRAVDFSEKSSLSQSQLDVWVRDTRLPKVSTQAIATTFEAAPAWNLTPLDRVLVTWEGVTYLVPVREASIPGGGADAMSVGFRKTVRSIKAGRIGKARAAA